MLPFDILCQIFDYYASKETQYPLETLLLVCKFWSQAACDYPRLWSSFKINTKHIIMWCARVPLRMSRCPDSLLDIEITVGNSTAVISGEDLDEYYLSLTESLTGKDGEVARRWRRLIAKDCGTVYWVSTQQSRLAKLLHFPTPNLEELSLDGLASSLPILPATPSLKKLTFRRNKLSKLPDLSTVLELSVCISGERYENALVNAVNLVKLDFLSGSFIYHIRGSYPHLKSITLPGSMYYKSLAGLEAPSLDRLCTSFGWAHQFHGLLACPGVPLQDVRELEIGAEIMSRRAYSQHDGYLDALRRFLSATKNVQVLVFTDAFISGVILKLLTGDCEPLYQAHRPLIKLYEHEIHLEQGPARRPSVDKLRNLVTGIPSLDASWEDIFRLLLDDTERRIMGL